MNEDRNDWNVVSGSIRDKVVIDTSDETIKSLMRDDECELYSPVQDIEDETWLRKNRPGAGAQVLSCPGCFSAVSYQSQEHMKFTGQYRSKEVWGCELGDELETQEGDHFLKVLCSECKAELGVWEIATGCYHLFHVLPGYG
jgi:hypothetical protein